jgi:adenylate cyclase class IV
VTTKAQHRELEVKLDAQGILIDDFKEWAFRLIPSKYLHVVGPDTYYTQGKSVLRHRQNGEGAGELTVKRRTSKKSTRDRLEIDLRFDSSTTQDDVTRFLLATGWEQKFTVIKDCHIFWYEDTKPGVEVVLYDVRCVLPSGKETDSRRFIEVEIHKADSLMPNALTTLKDWEASVREVWSGLETMTESLYEIYSGKRYGLIKP